MLYPVSYPTDARGDPGDGAERKGGGNDGVDRFGIRGIGGNSHSSREAFRFWGLGFRVQGFGFFGS
jgi:hypothetical protein